MKEILAAIIVLTTWVWTIDNYEPILKEACEVTNNYIKGVDYNRQQAEKYWYKDVYVFDKEELEKHNNICEQYK